MRSVRLAELRRQFGRCGTQASILHRCGAISRLLQCSTLCRLALGTLRNRSLGRSSAQRRCVV
ncbi:hypothetical protein MA16_Dca016937 [Dendrobium catenatum]|uniref:Uncharacterized protein n=1 Tax=Dendrobium catenatum TaxID=906689 RepID=A0A2I0VWI4_9ASPA|nr:hypothetical protein MA16_Dca016937 [Dendrobium catenatum]